MENSKSTSCSTLIAIVLPEDRDTRTGGNSRATAYLEPTKVNGTFRVIFERRSTSLVTVVAACVFSTLAALVGSPQFAEAAADHVAAHTDRLELIMLEEKGCGYCQRWHQEVGPIYGLSDEGKRAPLKRIDLASTEAARFARVTYTPTFVLVRDDEERGRITGYPGADFFWSMLSDQLRKLDQERENSVGGPFDPFNPNPGCGD
jgi:hypothetical protein